ncbi:stage III sporulation protein AA [Hominenteromicrobium sp.]|uniref:stage III sporulation protein AA n=1 Tax=Hominenteromicrobium sp. TaxID=3073581 RepID=UPI003A8E1EB0
MDFEKAIRPLGRFTPMLEKVPQAVRDAVFDIRISVDKPVLLCCGDRILFLREDGGTAQYFSQNNVTATREDVEEIFLRLCGYSVYSHMEEIRGGFVSADRALRVGIGGTAVIEKGGIKTVRDVTSLSVRIPREKRGCAEEVLRCGVDLSRGLLLAGAPSSGKTTLLRDIARYIGTAGHRVVVLDERFELSADGFDLGACTDILQGYPKQEGLSHAVRCLSPEYIVCDELGENDLSAIRSASFSGVALIASIHAGSVHELCCRPLCRGILSLGAFETVAHAFFTYRGDEALCAAFIDGFGKTDLDGQMAYFALHEGRVRSALLAAEQSLAQKGRLCVALGLFVGVSAALILL